MSGNLITAIVGILGIMIGALIQFWLTRRSEALRFERDVRHQAYRKYLEGVSQLSFSADDNDAHLRALAVTAEARGQIALCGSDQVIMCLNRVFKHGDNIRSIEAIKDIQSLLQAMRSDTLGRSLPGMETELFLMFYGNGPGGKEL